MTIIDFVIIILVGIGAYKGYKDGLLVTLISFLAFIIAILAAFKLLDTGMRLLSGSISGKLLPLVTFVLIFILVYIAILYLAKFLKSVLDYTLFGKFDAIVGAILGIIAMMFGISLLIWLIDVIRMKDLLVFFKGSFFYPKLVNFAPMVVRWISYIIPFQDIFHSLKQTLK